MYKRIKTIYYCGFCKKKGLMSHHIVKHESHCSLNPNRRCKVCQFQGTTIENIEKVNALYAELETHRVDGGVNGVFCKEFEDAIKKFALEELDGCPICMLAILRQVGGNVLSYANYDYKKEAESYFAEKRQEEYEADARAEYYSNAY